MRYFVDMDGTLAVYPSTKEAWWEVKGIFKFLTPQDKVIKAVKRLIENGHEVFILSAYNPDFAFALDEKNHWLDEHLPEVDLAHRIYTRVGESKVAAVPGGLKATDVLLDDYNKNLETWHNAGGKGIKLLNGLNNRNTWNGAAVRANGTIKEIEQTLINFNTI